MSGSVALRWRGLVGTDPPQVRASVKVWPVRPDGPSRLLLREQGGTVGTSPAHPSGAKAPAGRGGRATFYLERCDCRAPLPN